MSKRRFEEANEGKPSIANDAPAGKFQNDQQVQPTSDASAASAGDPSFALKKHEVKGSQLKQEAAASVVKNSLLGGSLSGDGATAGGMRGVSGAQGGVLGSSNATPRVEGDKSRSDTRYGKKLDRNSNKINFIPSDQVLVDVDESKPLSEAPDQEQGYNGTYRNEFARSQKTKGAVPGALMFQRSVDEIRKDTIYFGQGQVVKQSGVADYYAPSKSSYKDANGKYKNPDSDNYNVPVGNYLPKKFHFTSTGEGLLKEFYFDEDSFACTPDAEGVNRAGSSYKIGLNTAELVREDMDTKAGDEKMDDWSPLPRAVRQPSQTVGFLRDLEAMTGNPVMLGYRKFSTSMSHFLNRTHRDGQSLVDPIIDAVSSSAFSFPDEDSMKSVIGADLDKDTSDGIMNDTAIAAHGYATAMIKAYDSPTKYKTKADFIIQPRSFRMHLQTADNNMDPLYCDKRFVQAYDASECYSTIDTDFDPTMPVLVTDKAGLVNKYSWNDLYAFYRLPTAIVLGHKKGTSTTEVNRILSKEYANKFLSGLYMHFAVEKDADNIDSLTASGSAVTFTAENETFSGAEILIKITNSSTSPFSTDDYHTCYVHMNGSLANNITLTSYAGYTNISYAGAPRIFNAGKGPFHYMYEDLRNVYDVEVAFPLLAGLADYFDIGGGKALYSVLGAATGATVPVQYSTCSFSLWPLILCAAVPNIVRSRINSFRDLLYYAESHGYPFSDLVPIKDVTTKSYSNFGYHDYDTELDVKPMGPAAKLKWLFPEFLWPVGKTSYGQQVVLPWYVNEQGFKGASYFDAIETNYVMSMPSIRSGVRLKNLDFLYEMDEQDIRLAFDMVASWYPIVHDLTITDGVCGFYKYDSLTDGHPYIEVSDIKIQQLLSLPRELGYVIDAPYGYLTAKVGTLGAYNDTESSAIGKTSHTIIYYTGDGAITEADGLFGAESVNVNRAANFTQEWHRFVANGDQPTHDNGMLFSLNQLVTTSSSGATITADRGVFSPFVRAYQSDVNPTAATNVPSLISLQKALWTRIQKLPFVISPFDCRDLTSSESSYNVVTCFDIYDLAYAFGLMGFRASDFRESVYNREKQYVNEGYLYVSDPWVEKSLLFRDGSVASGVKVSKGFEV